MKFARMLGLLALVTASLVMLVPTHTAEAAKLSEFCAGLNNPFFDGGPYSAVSISSMSPPTTMRAGETVTVRLSDFNGSPTTLAMSVDGAEVYSVPVDAPLIYTFQEDTALYGLGLGLDAGGAIWDVSCANPGPGPDMVPIPETAVGGAFTQTTPIYHSPSMDAVVPDVVVEAGKTIWVYGLDESGGFYKVMLAGNFFWVPVETLGPNYDDVWQGTPLPTVVVE